MDPRLRTLLFTLGMVALAAWVGVSLANEEYMIATLAAGASVWTILAWTRGPLAESWLLGFLFFGYVVGNRGFAQITPIARVPLFLGELGLAVTLALVLLRGALQRQLPLRRDWLGGMLLLWLALGCGRIGLDVHTYGFIALRDFAMVYYVLYFLATLVIVGHAPSRGVIRAALQVTFCVLPMTGALALAFPDFFNANLLVDGVPLIFYKADLLATFLFTGFIVLLPASGAPAVRDWWRWLAAIASLVLALPLLSRSSLLGLLVALAWLVRAGRWRPAIVFGGVCATGLLAVLVVSLLQHREFNQTRAYAIYEAATSVADFSGTRDYQNDESSDKGDNNRFRLVWWRNVFEETTAANPLLGQGFGADLAHGFLIEYYPTGGSDFLARSPHNVFLTTFGRMGALGTLVLAAVYWLQARNTLRVARESRAAPAARTEAMTLQAATWVIMISSCFGVVLEGPMGAIPFWILLGVAHFLANQTPAPGPAEIAAGGDRGSWEAEQSASRGAAATGGTRG